MRDDADRLRCFTRRQHQPGGRAHAARGVAARAFGGTIIHALRRHLHLDQCGHAGLRCRHPSDDDFRTLDVRRQSAAGQHPVQRLPWCQAARYGWRLLICHQIGMHHQLQACLPGQLIQRGAQ